MSEESSKWRALTTEEIEECRANLNRNIKLIPPGWPKPNHLNLIATLDARRKEIDDLVFMLDVSNRQLADICGMVGDGPAAETVRRALAEKDAEIERLRKEIGERDRYEKEREEIGVRAMEFFDQARDDECHEALRKVDQIDVAEAVRRRDDMAEFIAKIAVMLGCNEGHVPAHDHRLCIEQAVMWGTGGERAEVRKIVEAHENESTPDAVHRALKELFAAYTKEMDDVARVAIEQIEGALHDGAIGMRDACLMLVRAAGQGQPPHVAAAMDALRRSIETLPA